MKVNSDASEKYEQNEIRPSMAQHFAFLENKENISCKCPVCVPLMFQAPEGIAESAHE